METSIGLRVLGDSTLRKCELTMLELSEVIRRHLPGVVSASTAD